MYTTPTMEMYEASAAYIRERMAQAGLQKPVLAVILGSGLGAYAASDAVADRITKILLTVYNGSRNILTESHLSVGCNNHRRNCSAA